ncbi:hypothetical protein ACKI1I_33535 [Streptomyces turgidiscabies]|nr:MULTISPECIES: hypothetical protein [Streptomyces]MDX3498773.1 hypothetical protein [Streptomyces turgidiscabies]GAQ74800.1 hypothetical protein T45_06580 [Streptomyces turgidiscabies]
MKPPIKSPLRALGALTVAAGLVLGFAGAAGAAPGASGVVPFGFAQRTVAVSGGQVFHLKLAATPTVLPAAGGTVDVAGTGYNRGQGIFLAFCVVPDGVTVGDPSTYTALPTPCLPGRADKDGSSRRITDSATGTPGITLPYRAGGSFLTTLNLRPEIADGVVCDVDVKCAIVTRADFTATADRSYDQYIPVSFGR